MIRTMLFISFQCPESPMLDAEGLKKVLNGKLIVRLACDIFANQGRMIEPVGRILQISSRIEEESCCCAIVYMAKCTTPADAVANSISLWSDARCVIKKLLYFDILLAGIAQGRDAMQQSDRINLFTLRSQSGSNARFPDDPCAQFHLGEAYALNGEYKEAIESFFSHKYMVFLVSNVTWRPRYSGNLLQLRCGFGIIGLKSKRSFSRKVPKYARMPFVKGSRKNQLKDYDFEQTLGRV